MVLVMHQLCLNLGARKSLIILLGWHSCRAYEGGQDAVGSNAVRCPLARQQARVHVPQEQQHCTVVGMGTGLYCTVL